MQFEDIIKLPWRDMIAILEKDGPTDCTWHAKSGWIESAYTQEQITKVNVLFWKCFDNLHINENTTEDKEKEFDDLSDAIEPWWYAMDDVEVFNKAIEPYLREDEKNVID